MRDVLLSLHQPQAFIRVGDVDFLLSRVRSFGLLLLFASFCAFIGVLGVLFSFTLLLLRLESLFGGIDALSVNGFLLVESELILFSVDFKYVFDDFVFSFATSVGFRAVLFTLSLELTSQ